MQHTFTALTRALRWITVVSIGVLSGCASTPDISLQPGYTELSPSHSLANIPYFPQVEDQCGPASLATVLVANGIDVLPEQLRDKIYIPGKQGAVTTEMVARARRYGLLAYVLRPELSDVLAEINAGTPVLVMQNLGFSWLPRWHFSVAVAYNLEAQTITLRSGDQPNHEIGIHLFLKTWRRANSWALAVMPAGAIPVTANAKQLLQAATDLEQVGEQAAALAVYQSILQRWPDHSLANFGAGNSAYALGSYQQAHDYFSAYLQAQPSAAEGWNNLAYSLVALACGPQALQAIHCGLALKPEHPMLIESLNELNSDIKNSSAKVKVCATIQCAMEP